MKLSCSFQIRGGLLILNPVTLPEYAMLACMPDELITRAREQAERSDSPVRVAALLRIARVETKLDPDKAQGQTLGERIAGKPLRIDELLDLASQAAAALEAVHRGGVTHRDNNL